MAKRRKQLRSDKPAAPSVDTAEPKSSPEHQTFYSSLPLHDLFEQQARAMLDRTDLDEEQKQNILIAMSCPCCGAGGMSFTAKLKR
jgi:hypothetical protein